MGLMSIFAATALQNPKKTALITEKNQLSFEDLLNLLHACDVQLQARGLRENATVVLHTDRAEFYMIFVFLASLRKLNIVFAKPSAVLQAEIEYDYYISTKDTGDIPNGKKLIIEGSWFSALGATPLPDYSQSTAPEATYTFVSSGSTGIPKFVRKSEVDRLRNIDDQAPSINSPTRATRYLSSLSVTMGWAMFGNVAALLAGGSAVILRDDRDKLLQYIDLYQVNNMITTPAMLSRMMEVEHAAQYLSSVDCILAGGAYTSSSLLDKFSHIYSGKLLVGYGATEIGGICTMIYTDYAKMAEGCIGKIYRDDIEVAFFDEDLNLLPDATEGVVGFKPLNKSHDTHYLGEQNEDKKSGFINGYFFPGDIMRREGDWLFIIGRVKNIINFSGNKVSLEALQTAIEVLVPDGLVACVAVADEQGLERLIVFYDGQNTISIAQVNTVIREKVGGISAAQVRKLAKIPLNENGKIDTVKLKDTASLNE